MLVINNSMFFTAISDVKIVWRLFKNAFHVSRRRRKIVSYHIEKVRKFIQESIMHIFCLENLHDFLFYNDYRENGISEHRNNDN